MEKDKLLYMIKGLIEESPSRDIFMDQPWFQNIAFLSLEQLEKLYLILKNDQNFVHEELECIALEDPQAFKEYLQESASIVRNIQQIEEKLDHDAEMLDAEDLLA